MILSRAEKNCSQNIEFWILKKIKILINQLAWRKTELLFKTSAEIQRIIKTSQIGNFRNVIFFRFQQFGRFFQAYCSDKFVWSQIDFT